jgi:hypothetical protein
VIGDNRPPGCVLLHSPDEPCLRLLGFLAIGFNLKAVQLYVLIAGLIFGFFRFEMGLGASLCVIRVFCLGLDLLKCVIFSILQAK